MAEDRVQLKREEAVGNDVVLSDINPKTNTNSVDDTNTGLTLDDTINKMWTAINNKLSRVVNSVNGRTGVVVLDSNDVGLGNVDNVSFADIKNWVIERLGEEFKNKRIQLYNSLDELDYFISEHKSDKSYAEAPFYSEHGYLREGDGDKRGHIGYIYWDDSTQSLAYASRIIHTIGYTDNSIIYNEKLSDDRNFSGGGIGVNIWKYENALEIYNDASGNKDESGLRINRDALGVGGKVWNFDSVYGEKRWMDEYTLIVKDTTIIPDVCDAVFRVYRDAASPSDITAKINKTIASQFRNGDLIIIRFLDRNFYHKNDDITDELREAFTYSDHDKFIGAQACICRVRRNEGFNIETDITYIDCYPMYITTGNGLGYSVNSTHKMDMIDIASINGKIDISNYSVDATGNLEEFNSEYSMGSYAGGLAYPTKVNESKTGNYDYEKPIPVQNLPSGPVRYDGNKQRSYFNLNLDNSLEVLPYSILDSGNIHRTDVGNNYKEHLFKNYPNTKSATYMPTTDRTLNNQGYDIIGMSNKITGVQNTVINQEGKLGIHLVSAIENYPPPVAEEDHKTDLSWISTEIFTPDPLVKANKFYNASGLKVVSPMTRIYTRDNVFNPDGQNHEGNPEWIDPFHHTGGLMINTGKFLGIDTGYDETAFNKGLKTDDTYYDGGKLSLRIDKLSPLFDSGKNELSVRISTPLFVYGDIYNNINKYNDIIDNSYHPRQMIPGGLTLIKNNKNEILVGVNYGPGITMKSGINRFGGSSVSKHDLNDNYRLSININDPATKWLDIYRYSSLSPEGEDKPTEDDIRLFKNYYGGLRFTGGLASSDDGAILAIRVNATDYEESFYKDDQPASPPDANGNSLHIGSNGLCIDEETNILGIQLFNLGKADEKDESKPRKDNGKIDAVNGLELAGASSKVIEPNVSYYRPGLRLRVNSAEGIAVLRGDQCKTLLTGEIDETKPETQYTRLDSNLGDNIGNMLHVKIYDISSAPSYYEMYNDPRDHINGDINARLATRNSLRNGLRFTASGYIGIRINNNGYGSNNPCFTSRYSSVYDEQDNPNISCISVADDTSKGTKGLCIDDQNVLGIQYDANTGLTIDGNGRLSIDKQKLKAYLGI